jgi:alpha-tubulin suppressor-like RCC1 family protein
MPRHFRSILVAVVFAFMAAIPLPIHARIFVDWEYGVPDDLTNVVAIATSDLHCLALKDDGTIAAWGFNNYGQTSVPTNLVNAVAIAAGENHSLALTTDGMVVAWGNNEYSQCAVPAGLSNVVAIAGGSHHSMALRADGTVCTWGSNQIGAVQVPMTVPARLGNVVAIAAGSQFCMALKGDGSVTVWGSYSTGSRSVPMTNDLRATNIVAIAGGTDHCLAVKADGTVLAWGRTYYSQCVVPEGLSNVLSVAAGEHTSFALQTDGSVIILGMSGSTTMAPFSNVVAVAAGGLQRLVLEGDGPPIHPLPLVSQITFLGGKAVFHASAVGLPPLTYQWQYQGTDLPNATNATLVLTNVQLAQAGTYQVVTSNALGNSTNGSRLDVMPLLVSTFPQSQNVLAMSAAFFRDHRAKHAPSFLPVAVQRDGPAR